MDIDVESFFVASLLERLPRRRNGFVQPHNMHTAATFSIWKDVNMFYSVLNFAKVSVKIMESLKIVQLQTIGSFFVLPSINQVNQHQKKIHTKQQIIILL